MCTNYCIICPCVKFDYSFLRNHKIKLGSGFSVALLEIKNICIIAALLLLILCIFAALLLLILHVQIDSDASSV